MKIHLNSQQVLVPLFKTLMWVSQFYFEDLRLRNACQKTADLHVRPLKSIVYEGNGDKARTQMKW